MKAFFFNKSPNLLMKVRLNTQPIQVGSVTYKCKNTHPVIYSFPKICSKVQLLPQTLGDQKVPSQSLSVGS